MAAMWTKRKRDFWFTDFTLVSDTTKLNPRGLPGFWQTADYTTKDFTGVMVTANPTATAPEIHVPLPPVVCVKGKRFGVFLGLAENYCDRVLVKLERQPTFDRMAHGDVNSDDKNYLQDCWYKDVDLRPGDALVLKQDDAMKRRCAIAYIRLSPAPPPTQPEIPVAATADGYPGNNGVISFEEMKTEETQFGDTHVTEIYHGTDISGCAQYTTRLPGHRYPLESVSEETSLGPEYYPWVLEQMLRYEKAGRCLLRDSIDAAHGVGRKLYAYHRMGICRMYAPMRQWDNPFFNQHPEWRVTDFDGTPLSKLSIAYPDVRRYYLDHFRETVEFGADGVCLVFCRGWPLVLFEKPVLDEYQRRTGKTLKKGIKKDAAMKDATLLAIRTELFNGFIREIHDTVNKAGKGRDVNVVALNLATPAINRYFAMDCRRWAREGWVTTFCPYPYGYNVKPPTPIDVPAWKRELKDTKARLLPILNRVSPLAPLGILERAERFLKHGADGLSMWDWDSYLAIPTYRELAYHVGSAKGRKYLRKRFSNSWPLRHQLLTIDGLTVDRYHPGWNV